MIQRLYVHNFRCLENFELSLDGARSVLLLGRNGVGKTTVGLRRAFRDTGQLIVTSHNPETVRRFSDDNTFCLARKSRLEPTTYRTVKAMRESGEYSGSLIGALMRGDIGSGAER